MNEEKVISIIRDYLKRQGFKTYRFKWSPFFIKFGGSPDIVGVKRGRIISCECKGSRLVMTHAIGQAITYKQFSDQVYIALPFKRIDEKIVSICRTQGVGIFSVVGDKVNPRVPTLTERLPSPLRKQVINYLEKFERKKDMKNQTKKKSKSKSNLRTNIRKKQTKTESYLMQFNKKLTNKWKGSLVKVNDVKRIEPNAKEYLNKLAKAGYVERIKWGWYWVPVKIKDIWDFLEKDKNFKVVSGQTAASLWNYDFIHRDVYILKVKDKSFGKAFKEFAKKKDWNVEVEYSKDSSKIKYRKIGNLLVEGMEDNVIECLQNWAFTDAFATLYANKDRINLDRLYKESYWKRISKTDVRVKQALEYGFHKMDELSGAEFPHREPKLEDDFVRRGIDEAIEKVVELG
jgi:hypothetical protein